MATAVSMNSFALPRFFAAGTTNTDNVRVLSLPGQNYLDIRPKVEASPFAAAASDFNIVADFANTGETNPGSVFGTFDNNGTAIQLYDGLRLRFSRLHGGGYFVGTKYYSEEGLLRLVPPVVTTFLGHHNAERPAGRLWIDDGVWKWFQADNAGTGSITYVFDQVTGAPILSGLAAPPYTYYRFVRSGSSMTLTVTDADGTRSQTITGVEEPTPVVGTGFDGIHSLGKRTIDTSAVIAWWRAASSNTTETPTSAGTTWTTPVYSSDLNILSDGNSTTGTMLDSNAVGSYWNYPTFGYVSHNHGSQLRARFLGLDAPSGQLDSQFSGEPWYDIPAGANTAPINLPGGGQQGRFLAIQLEFVASTTAPLQGGDSSLWQTPGSFVIEAQHRATAWPVPVPEPDPEPVELAVPTINGTLPVPVSRAVSIDHEFPTAVASYEAPYTQSYALAENERPQVYQVSWAGITQAELDLIISFFEIPDRVFLWTHPETQASSPAILAPNALAPEWRGPGVFNMSARFAEVRDAA